MDGDQLLREVLKYYNINSEKGIPYKKELDRLNSLNILTFGSLVFPYKFVDKYIDNTQIYRDGEEFPFVLLDGNRKLFFHKNLPDLSVKLSFLLLQIEQDIESPHHYLPILSDSDITLDIGCAEANFTFLNYNNSREFHLFDNEIFRDVIHKTFKENDNVIYHSGVVNISNRIDSIKFNGKVDNIKVDVEGMEYEVLVGAKQTIFKNKPFIQVCTYHTQGQFEEVYTLLETFGYQDIKCSDGYMLFPESPQEPPYFRKGLLYAK